MNKTFKEALNDTEIRASIPEEVLGDLLICANANDTESAKQIIDGYLAHRYSLTLDWLYSLLNPPVIVVRVSHSVNGRNISYNAN